MNHHTLFLGAFIVDVGPGKMCVVDEHPGINRPPHHEFNPRFVHSLLNQVSDPGMTQDMGKICFSMAAL